MRGFLLRPWRIAAGVCFGLACGTKWSAIFVVAGFGLLIWAWDSGMRRSIGVRWAPVKSLVVDAIPSFFSIVVVGLVVYVVTWMGFLTHAEKFEEAFGTAADDKGETLDLRRRQPARDRRGQSVHDLNILWNYHKEVYAFHTGDYIKDADAPVPVPPRRLARPQPTPRDRRRLVGDNTVIPNCPEGQDCVKQILAIGTPVLWWGGVLALFVGGGLLADPTGLAIRHTDRRRADHLAAVVPVRRPADLLLLRDLDHPVHGHRRDVGARQDDRQARRRPTSDALIGTVAAGVFVLAVALNFVYFYPILTVRPAHQRGMERPDVADEVDLTPGAC